MPNNEPCSNCGPTKAATHPCRLCQMVVCAGCCSSIEITNGGIQASCSKCVPCRVDKSAGLSEANSVRVRLTGGPLDGAECGVISINGRLPKRIHAWFEEGETAPRTFFDLSDPDAKPLHGQHSYELVGFREYRFGVV